MLKTFDVNVKTITFLLRCYNRLSCIWLVKFCFLLLNYSMVWCHNFQSCCCRRATLWNYVIRVGLLHIVILNLSLNEHIVASTKPEQAVVKPVTRKETNVWLVGQLSSTFVSFQVAIKERSTAPPFFYYKQPVCNEKNSEKAVPILNCYIVFNYAQI